MNEAGNFTENIHMVNYEEAYHEKSIGYESLINDYYRKKESLCGMWRFGIDQYDNCLRSKWYEEKYRDEEGRRYPMDFDFDAWEKMPIPSCWNMWDDKLFLYEGSMVYTREFDYINHGEKRVFIKFGGANYKAFVFLNKQYLGLHKGGSTPFYVEVSDYLQAENRLLVVVNNTRQRVNVPCENTDWFNYGGIYRDVELLRLPKAFIRDYTITLKQDGAFNKIELSVKTDGAESGEARIEIPELGIDEQIAVNAKASQLSAAPELWSPENPKLYDITITFGEDILRDRVGFREIKAVGTDIYLNGQKIFLRGINKHEESVLNGKSLTEEEIREDFLLAKEMNCNFVRLAHYPHDQKAAYIADEMGILLWEEIPVYWAIEFGSKSVFQDAKNQLSELIIRDRNRASVIIWSIGNENADTDERFAFMRALAQAARELDITRLISAACMIDHVKMAIADRLEACIDVIGVNEYYGWYEPDFTKLPKIFENSKPGKPVVISEFGADARAFSRGTRDDLYTEDHQLEVYRKQIETIKKIPYVKGTCPWILFDFRCPRRLNHAQRYYNIKGLTNADRTHKKLAFYAMKEFYAARM